MVIVPIAENLTIVTPGSKSTLVHVRRLTTALTTATGAELHCQTANYIIPHVQADPL